MNRLIVSVTLALLAAAAAAQSQPIAPNDGGPTPVFERLTFPAERIFEPRSAALSAEGRQSLGAVATKVRGIALEVVIAVDYGELSVARAAALKQYLVSAGIDAGRVYAEGQPRPGRARVEIEVVGAR
jgi:hypothetical protein